MIVGFAIHNTTEGFALAAPLSKTKSIIPKLIGLGLIAGTPAIFGAWIGGFFFSPFSAVIFLGIAAGAIFQVIISIILWQKKENNFITSWPLMLGISLGLLVMYSTSIIIYKRSKNLHFFQFWQKIFFVQHKYPKFCNIFRK